MTHLDLTFIVLIFFRFYCVWSEDSSFTKIGEILRKTYPIKLNDEIHLVTYDSKKVGWSIFSTEHIDQTCRFPDVNLLHAYTLGNGKIVAFGDTFTQINVIDLKNCSYPVTTSIYIDDNYDSDSAEYSDYKFGSAVTYNDTFDIFDWYQKRCMPCRYNDKGERLQVQNSLETETVNENPYQHDGYSLELIEDAFGVKNGYLYVFKFTNSTTALKILNSNFKVVKQRLFDAKIEAYSLLRGNITVCYKKDACKPSPSEHCFGGSLSMSLCLSLLKTLTEYTRHTCQRVECHLLDSDLKTLAEVKLHEVHENNCPDRDNTVEMIVKNLVGGDAMVAMTFKKYWNENPVGHSEDVFVQEINPNGHVYPPILYDSLENSFVHMHHFVFGNGEYCLVTVNDGNEGSYTSVKCLNPATVNYEKL